MNDRIYLTKFGLARLQKRLTRARADYRAVCSDNPEARESGDSSVWHDNFAFEENQRRMHQLARLVRDLEMLVAGVDLIEPPEDPERVAIATRVRFCVEGESSIQSLFIAGFDDGDPAVGRVGYNSPIARALISAEPGDIVCLPGGPTGRHAKVLAVDPWWEERGRLIVFEGLDGTGKSTAARRVADALHADLISTPPEPLRSHRTAIESSLRGQPNAITSFYLEGDLLASDRARECIAIGRTVVMDRYIVSTVVNARLRGDDIRTDSLEECLLRPDLTIIIELDEAVRIERLRGRGMTDHDHTTVGETSAQLAAAYRDEAQKRGLDSVHIVDATGLDEEAVVARCLGLIRSPRGP